MNIRISFFLISFLLVIGAYADKKAFTPLEQQQISIPTSGLFEKSQSFTVDFTSLKETDYSFPLPVGRAKVHSARGVEIVTKKGDAVKAVFAGTVRLSRYNASYGYVVVIRHRNGLETVYAGNAQNLVKSGDYVKAGQTIAIVGEEGGEAKCFFGIMVNGGNVNPDIFINISNHRLRKRIFLFKNKGKSVDVTMLGNDSSEDAIRSAEDENMLDMDSEFTARERQVVSAPTVGLFEKSNTITINLWSMKEKEWCYPLPGCKVISPFGRRGGRSHSGVDLKTKAGDDIRAAFSGKVRFAGKYSGYGNVIVIRHASGMETLYSHNASNSVKVGDWVNAGQVIGLVGRTGRASTEHLHFEIRINGRPYNPALIFEHSTHKLRAVKIIATKGGGISTINMNKRMAEADSEGKAQDNRL